MYLTPGVLYHCPTCGKRGMIVQTTPKRKRRCKNGHVWFDGVMPQVQVTKLDRQAQAITTLLAALKEAETMIRDCSGYMTVAQQNKECVPSLLWKISKTISIYKDTV